jgi:hypothetical protein
MIFLARSVTSSMSPVQAPVDRYFQPPSADTTTMDAASPSGTDDAHLIAPASAAPVEIPAKIPTSVSRRVHSIDSRGRTTVLRSNSSAPPSSSKIGGMYPSSRFRRPSTISPAGGSTAQIDTASPSFSRRKRPTPSNVPEVPSPATKCVTPGQSRRISGPVPS